MGGVPLSTLAQDATTAVRLQERIAVFLLGFSAFLPLYAPQSVLPQLAADFGTTPAATGGVIGATTLAVACSAPVAGPLTDLFGRKRAMLTAILLLVPLTLLLTLCHDLTQLLGVRFSQGIALPALFTGAVAYISSRWSGSQAAAMTGLFVSGSAMGGFAGRFVAGLLAELVSWQSGFTALALISALCALVVLLWLPADRGRPIEGIAAHVAGMRAHLANPRIRAVCAFGSTVLFSMTATLSYVGFHLAGPPFLLTASGIGLVFLVYPISASAAPFNGRLIQRFGTRGAFLAALGVCFCGQMVLLLPHLVAVIAGIGLFIAGIFLCQSLALGYVGRTATVNKGAAAGLYVCFFYIGGSLGAVLPGLSWAAAGWPGCVALVCVALGLGAVISRAMSDAPRPA